MKVRFSQGRIRVRLDDLEIQVLNRQEALQTLVEWAGGGWALVIDPNSDTVEGRHGNLSIGIYNVLPDFLASDVDGIVLEGSPQITLQKDYLESHLR